MKRAERKELALWHAAICSVWQKMKPDFEADGFFSEWCYVLWASLNQNPYGHGDLT